MDDPQGYLQGIGPSMSAPLQVNFTPRQYQLELLQACLTRNSVVCLQSGSAKDFIAVMLIKELSSQVRSTTDGCKRRLTLFVVNSDKLVALQADVIRTHTNLIVSQYAEDWETSDGYLKSVEWTSCQFLVLPYKALLKFLSSRFMESSSVNAIIFDECHPASEEHSYRDMMRLFDHLPPGERPRILGLTSSLLIGRLLPRKLEETLGNLERNLKSTIETAINVQSVSRYGTRPKEIIIECGPYEGPTTCWRELLGVLEETLSNLERYTGTDSSPDEGDPTEIPRQAIQEAIRALTGIGPLGLKLMVQLLLHEMEKFEKHPTSSFNKLLCTYACSQLRYVRKRCVIECDSILCEGESIWSPKLVTPKFRKLIGILQAFRPQTDPQTTECNMEGGAGPRALNSEEKPAADFDVCDEEEGGDIADDEEEEEELVPARGRRNSTLCGIVFTEGRFMAFLLDTLLRKFQRGNPDLRFISSCSIRGHGLTGLGERQTPAQARKQEQMLRRFRRHETQLLFATSILEEGVDVPRCNLVVRFDPPTQYRSYIQSKARARAHSSYFVLLVDTAKKDSFAQDLKDYTEIDKILQNKCHFREADSGDQVDIDEVDRLLPPLAPSKEEGSPRLTLSAAITLVNRYCAKLPSDSFTHLTPTWQIRHNEGTDTYQCTLNLPINSPLREPVVGPDMPSKKLAKMAAALAICKCLYNIGEINDDLLPVGKEMILEHSDLKADLEEIIEGEGRPGTIQRRQYYDKAIAACLADAQPSPGTPCYLYVITMRMSVPLPAVLNVRERKIHDPKETHQCFGILTSNAIPKVPSFPVYTRDGELSVSVELVTSAATFASAELELANAFHQCIFSDVLRLQKPNILFSPQESPASCVIVPLSKTDDNGPDTPLSIDWPFLKRVSQCSQSLDNPPSLPDYSSQEFVFDSKLYEDAVVTPIYRNIDQPQRYFVAEILHDKLVTSPFPSEKYEKYIDYFFERYGIEISNFRQPVLDVDCMSSRLNLLTPRYLNHKGKALPIGSKQAKKSSAQKKQYLVPELCYVYPIPASMWRKAICLPSVLYRLNSLLVAEELRVLLSLEALIGSLRLPPVYPFQPLSFGWQGLDSLEQSHVPQKQSGAVSGDMCNQDGATSVPSSTSEDAVAASRVSSDNHSGPPVTGESNPSPGSTSDNAVAVIPASSDSLSKSSMMGEFGPSPGLVLQALTMSNASDGFNLERLEMLGDSFLKQAVTVYLYCQYHTLHEGKLSFLRSKQVSNFNLYRLGRRRDLAHWMQVCLFDPAINWLPPGYVIRENQPSSVCVPPEQVEEYISDEDGGGDPDDSFDIGTWQPSSGDEWTPEDPYVYPGTGVIGSFQPEYVDYDSDLSDDGDLYGIDLEKGAQSQWSFAVSDPEDVPGLSFTGPKMTNTAAPLPELPYEIHTQHSLSDKSVADCVEALIGCCLVSCGFRSGLLFLCWIGLKVLPDAKDEEAVSGESESGSSKKYGYLSQPLSPLFKEVPGAKEQLIQLLDKFGHKEFEAIIGYTFRDKAYLLQALTHASYHLNQVTDCYQRLEFLGDALLDYLITKHLYDNYRNLSPGALTDLRSALVNNTIFASLAVKYRFHQFFLHLSPDLFKVIGSFVSYVREKKEALGMESELKLVGIADTDEEQEDIEVPKALGDIFESIAGAVYLDSNMSMEAVWDVYYPMMKQQIEQYAANLPISPVRELLEMEPETAKFGPPERTMDGKTRVTVNVVGKGQFKGVGRNYRIAKATAARCALRHLKK